MNIMEIANALLKKLYQSNLEVELDLCLDNTVNNAVKVYIDVKSKYFNNFSISFGTKDTVINFSSVFKLGSNNVLEAERLFKENSGIFDDLIYIDEDDLVLLVGQIEIKEFDPYDEGCFDDYLIDKVISYLKEEHELITYLNTLS